MLRRRVFAVPLPGRRGDGDVELPASALGLPARRTHVDDLDAADPLHRDAIEAIGLIADYGDEATIPSRGGVVNELWTDDPPEAWQAARRMLDRGLDRRKAMERLTRLWRTHAPDEATLAQRHGAARAGRRCVSARPSRRSRLTDHSLGVRRPSP